MPRSGAGGAGGELSQRLLQPHSTTKFYKTLALLVDLRRPHPIFADPKTTQDKNITSRLVPCIVHVRKPKLLLEPQAVQRQVVQFLSACCWRRDKAIEKLARSDGKEEVAGTQYQ